MYSQLLCLLLYLLLNSEVSSGSSSDDSEGSSVRLVGPNNAEGRVEVRLEGVWRRWCGTGILDNEATVVCGQLGLGFIQGFGITNTAFHGQGSSQYFISNVDCTGNEDTIANCSYSTVIVENCNDVAVICRVNDSCDAEVPVRLINGTTESDGLVDICRNGFRIGVCHEDINTQTASQLCTELGFTNNSPPGVLADNSTHYLRTLNISSQSTMTGRICLSVRLSCTDTVPTSLSPPASITTTATDSSSFHSESVSSSPSSNNSSLDIITASVDSTGTINNRTMADSQLVLILVIVCAVLGALLISSIAVFIVIVLCLTRRRSQGIMISNIESLESLKSYPQNVDTRLSVIPVAETNVSEMPMETNVSYETTISTKGNICYETAAINIPTTENVCYKTTARPAADVNDSYEVVDGVTYETVASLP